MLVRRHGQTIMFNAKDTYSQCMKEVEGLVAKQEGGSYKGSSGDNMRVECVRAYKNDLKKNVEKVQSIYEGYLQNYSQKDGSLLSYQALVKAEGKAIQEIKRDLQATLPGSTAINQKANDVL